MMMGLMIGGKTPEVDPKNKKRAVKYWMYGAPASELAIAWGIDEDVADLKKCANCEYFDNRVSTLKATGGKTGQGACSKFKFLCSDEASCQAWECKADYELEHMLEDEDDSSPMSSSKDDDDDDDT
jgi:hypothetical protein